MVGHVFQVDECPRKPLEDYCWERVHVGLCYILSMTSPHS